MVPAQPVASSPFVPFYGDRLQELEIYSLRFSILIIKHRQKGGFFELFGKLNTPTERSLNSGEFVQVSSQKVPSMSDFRGSVADLLVLTLRTLDFWATICIPVEAASASIGWQAGKYGSAAITRTSDGNWRQTPHSLAV
jgi:hypothetical protein